ncbi:hypothetical protein PR202_gb11648 [Eleusine coracana subsp. coracana]|uniref:U3 snoRNP-associated protein-like EMB2271 n=1 Tax=Eleusine coracana subsp. coracana TaxID=191504 RepID=A0AAV5ENH0_ELECO|nr:hypothetical protein PR202_gb11648 [Eleusine coracana subsp. coracana]
MAPRPRKRASRPKPRPGSRSRGGDEDSFFESEPKRRRGGRDEDIESEESDDDQVAALGGGGVDDDEDGGEEDDEETVGEKKMRMAKELLKKVKEAAKKKEEDEDEDEDEAGGRRVAEILLRKQLEESGRKRRDLAARVLSPGPEDGFKAFSGHRGPISCLAFGPDSSELFSGSFDRSIMQWNAEDRTYMNCLYGHQNEILTMDALNKDRLLTVARDRTMHLWKIPEESQLVFRAPAAASLECSCFIDDKEFLSGSDDGSIELWSIMRKKPTHIIRNAHPVLHDNCNALDNAGQELPKENGTSKHENVSSAQSWVSAVAARKGSDLAASGAGNGLVRLWAIEPDSKGIRPIFDLKLDGFVNSLAIANSGRFIVAGVGQINLTIFFWSGTSPWKMGTCSFGPKWSCNPSNPTKRERGLVE